MKINLPENVEKIIETLEAGGYEAYAVGGCVRDSILGRTPNDWDITTSATPQQTKALFKRTFDTGIAHGTVSVLFGKEIYEVTTFRIDGKYEDSRHPKEVTFTVKLEDDLLRRDFTINAMAYNNTRGLVDIYGGMDDIQTKTIRCVGNPFERFSEDALRMLRAVRFAATLDYEIEENTKEAIRKLSPNLSKISAERIQVELVKTMLSPHPEYMRTAYELGITKVFLPEFDAMMETPQNNPHHMYSVGEHTLKVCENVEADRMLRLSALLHDVAKPVCKTTDENGIDHFKGHQVEGAQMARTILKRLKFDNDTIDCVSTLVRYHDERPEATRKAVRRCINRIGEECFPKLFYLHRADLLGQSDYQREEKFEHLESFERVYYEIQQAKECVSLKTLAVKGKDLIEAGVEPGPNLGKILNEMLEAVLDEPSLNDKEELIKRFVHL